MKRLLVSVFLLLMGLGCMAQTDFFGSMEPARQTKSKLPDTPNVTDSQGRKQGAWSKRYDNGNYRYQATFVDNKPVGMLTRYHENGKKSVQIDYRADGKGYARLYDDTEKLMAEGLYLDTRRDSLWRYYNVDNQLNSVEPYVNGELNGVVVVYYPNGDVAEEITYLNGRKEGSWFQYYRGNGKKLMAAYHNNLLHGSYKTYSPLAEGDMEGQYENGQEQGIWKIYDSEKREYYNKNYKNGVLQNSAELEKRMQEKAAEYEKNRKFIKDPEQFRSDPDGYLR